MALFFWVLLLHLSLSFAGSHCCRVSGYGAAALEGKARNFMVWQFFHVFKIKKGKVETGYEMDYYIALVITFTVTYLCASCLQYVLLLKPHHLFLMFLILFEF